MVKLLISSVTYHKLQNMICDIITHVPLNTINGVVTTLTYLDLQGSYFFNVRIVLGPFDSLDSHV